MQTMPLVCVTVVAEAVLEQRLLRDVQATGARGWTVSEARGQGTRSVRASEWEGANVRLETLVTPDVAQRLLAVLARDYFPHFAVVAWTSEVHVIRGEKYT